MDVWIYQDIYCFSSTITDNRTSPPGSTTYSTPGIDVWIYQDLYCFSKSLTDTRQPVGVSDPYVAPGISVWGNNSVTAFGSVLNEPYIPSTKSVTALAVWGDSTLTKYSYGNEVVFPIETYFLVDSQLVKCEVYVLSNQEWKKVTSKLAIKDGTWT